jgi:hypothetical protein
VWRCCSTKICLETAQQYPDFQYILLSRYLRSNGPDRFVAEFFGRLLQTGFYGFLLLRNQKNVSASALLYAQSSNTFCIETVYPVADLFVRNTVKFFKFACALAAGKLKNCVHFYAGNVIFIAFKERFNLFGCIIFSCLTLRPIILFY